MEKYPDTSLPSNRELRDLPLSDKLEIAAVPDTTSRKKAIKRWYDLRSKAAANQYYRRLVRRSPNRRRDQQSFGAMGRMMIEQSVNAEPTSGRRRLRRRQLMLKWRNFMQATIARW
jgi:hypothetical protein